MDPQPALAPWRIVLFTDFGPQLVQAAIPMFQGFGHKVVCVVTSPGLRGARRDTYVEIVRAVPPGIDVVVSNYPRRWAAMLAPLRPDVIVSASFPWILPDDLIALPRVGAINMHPSLLPRGRGPNSVGWALRNGDAQLGFTIHRIDSGLDTGAILAQAPLPIDDDDDADTLFARMSQTVPGLLGQAFARLAASDPGEVQDETQATYAGAFEEEWRYIDWSQPARTIHNQVRAWTVPARGAAPGAVATLDGEAARIFRTRIAAEAGGNLAAGVLISRDEHGPIVQCGAGAVQVLMWEPVAPVTS